MGLVERCHRRARGDKILMLYLASRSPRRTKLLKEAGIRHRILKIDFKESCPSGAGPVWVAKKNALGKAKMASAKIKNGLILAADTFVYFKGRIIGKPGSKREAEKTLRSLQGIWHIVYTAVAILDVKNSKVKKNILFCEKTKVRLKAMSLSRIRGYFRRVNPMDKAGAYAIQSRSNNIVQEVRGSFSNAVGLPMERLCARMKKL